jgi:hypothetical protein
VNEGLLHDDKTAKGKAHFNTVLGFYLKAKYFGDAVTQA